LALLFFEEFPVAEDLGGGFSLDVAEDVGVAADHFVVDFADDVVDGEAALFGGDLSVEEDLEEEVAKFLGEFGVVAGVEGVEDFVGFFDQVGAQGGMGLLAVPGAAAGSAEAGHDGGEFGEGGAGILGWGGFFCAAGFGSGFLAEGRELFCRHAGFFFLRDSLYGGRVGFASGVNVESRKWKRERRKALPQRTRRAQRRGKN